MPSSARDHSITSRSTAHIILLVACMIGTSHAGDWPQILGPHRNGTAENEVLAPWPEDGLQVKWTRNIGEGYAGPAVAGGKVIIFHRRGESEHVEALNAQSGAPAWKREFPASYAGGVDPDRGPRCVPLVHDGCVYLFGAGGDLHAISLADGKHLWSRRVYREFSGLVGYFGAGSTPIVVGDRMLVNAGGRDDAGVVAFSLRDGTTLWKTTSERASYSSPALTNIRGKVHAVFVTRLNAVVLSPDNGEVAFQFPFGQRGPTVNAATPLVFDGHLFVTASYGVGARLVRFDTDGIKTVWESDQALSSQYPTPVYAEGHLYGTHGREDVGVAELRCVEATTGRVLWSEPDFGMAHLILAGERMLVLRVDGRLMLAEVSPQRLKVLADATVSTDVTRALPALAHGKLYFRTNAQGGGQLKCISLRP